MAVVVAGCTGDPAPTTTTAAVTTSTSVVDVTTTTSVPEGGVPEPGSDLLTFANGVLLVTQTGLDTTNSGTALQMVDGDPARVTMTTGSPGPVVLVFKMPSDTTFETFSIPNVVASRGNATMFGSIKIEGSAEGPETGYELLAEGVLSLQSAPESVNTILPDLVTAVRWIRVTLEGALEETEDGGARTRFEFTEIVGTGTQAEQPLSDAFDGVWELTLTSRPQAEGERLELIQDGTLITGCLDTFEIRGAVNGAVARATSVDPATGRTGAVVFVADEDGAIAATISYDNGRFESRIANPPPRESQAECALPPSETAVCNAPLYVNFDYDSAEIRAESQAVIDDIYRVLLDLGITSAVVEGHTSTEGTDEHNQVLSEERAAAVVAALVERGFPAAGLTAVGLGETEPLVSPDDDEASRSINRRVELECGQ